MMNTKEYADILRLAIKLQIDDVEKDMKKLYKYGSEDFSNGVIQGLRIALEKIDASAFLME